MSSSVEKKVQSSNYCCVETLRGDLISFIDQHKEKLSEHRAFASMSDEMDGILYVFLPLKSFTGKDMGYIISHCHVDDYGVINRNYTILLLMLNSLVLVIMWVIITLYCSARRTKTVNEELELKVEEKVKELRDKELFFAQQSKMVTMGEMLGSIIHQWKQPISSISLIADLMLYEANNEGCDKEMAENLKSIKEQVYFMNQTSDDFRNFMKPSNELIVFNIADAVESVMNLFSFSFVKYNIDFKTEWSVETRNEALISGYPNELKHVLLNFFNNARDAIVETREEKVSRGEDVSGFKGVITVAIETDVDSVIVKVSDTGGGIPEHLLNSIFKKYFSTKDERGSGIGLYMNKDLVETSMNGKITVRNIIGGAEFTIRFPKAVKK